LICDIELTADVVVIASAVAVPLICIVDSLIATFTILNINKGWSWALQGSKSAATTVASQCTIGIIDNIEASALLKRQSLHNY